MKKAKAVSKAEERRARAIVQRAIDQQQRADVAAKKRLIGRCFKYQNRYSDGDVWWLYAIVTGVDEHGRLSTINLQATSSGSVEVQSDTYPGLLPYGGWVAIERAEFDAACVNISLRFLTAIASAQSFVVVVTGSGESVPSDHAR